MGKILSAECKCGFKIQKIFVDRGGIPTGYCNVCHKKFSISVDEYISLNDAEQRDEEQRMIKCPDCNGYDVTTLVCFAPALCQNCNEMKNLNYKDKNIRCPDCGNNVTFYHDPSLQNEFPSPHQPPVSQSCGQYS